jgi:hypothetical protein
MGYLCKGWADFQMPHHRQYVAVVCYLLLYFYQLLCIAGRQPSLSFTIAFQQAIIQLWFFTQLQFPADSTMPGRE